jgi:hypothetical protein
MLYATAVAKVGAAAISTKILAGLHGHISDEDGDGAEEDERTSWVGESEEDLCSLSGLFW